MPKVGFAFTVLLADKESRTLIDRSEPGCHCNIFRTEVVRGSYGGRTLLIFSPSSFLTLSVFLFIRSWQSLESVPRADRNMSGVRGRDITAFIPLHSSELVLAATSMGETN